MSNFPTPLEEVIHHNVIKNNKTGGPALDIGQARTSSLQVFALHEKHAPLCSQHNHQLPRK